jgi:hypothetical protein
VLEHSPYHAFARADITGQTNDIFTRPPDHGVTPFLKIRF